MFKPIIIKIALVGMFIFTANCQETPGILDSALTNSSIVPYSEIPRPFTESTYFLYGANLQKGAEPILEKLLQARIAVQDAWTIDETQPGPCSMPILSQLIIRTGQPDKRVYNFGFVSDSSRVVINECTPYWLYYRFTPTD